MTSTRLLVLLCLQVFASTFSLGVFPALLPEMGTSVRLPDWQLGAVIGAYGFARMVADIPVGLFVTHHLRRAVVLGPLVLAAGVLSLGTADSFATLILGRAILGVGHSLGMIGGLTAILRYHAGRRLGAALNAIELSAILGIIGGVTILGALPASLPWSTALLLASAPQVIGLLVLPALVGSLPPAAPGTPAPLFARDAAARREPPAPVTLLAVLAFATGISIAMAYSTVEQFLVPLRGSREFGLDRIGIARLLMTAQLCDIVALLPVGMLADRHGAARTLRITVLVMATAITLVAFGTLPWLALGCALFGLAMAGWMLPLSVLRRETPAGQVGWRTALYRVGIDGAMFVGPFISGLLGPRARVVPAVVAGVLVTVSALLATRRS